MGGCGRYCSAVFQGRFMIIVKQTLTSRSKCLADVTFYKRLDLLGFGFLAQTRRDSL